MVADVVERGREPEDVVAVERRHERPVDEPDQLGRQLVAVVLALLDLGDQLAAVLGVLREQLGEEPGDLDDVARGVREQLEEPPLLGFQTEAHRAASTRCDRMVNVLRERASAP